MRVLPLSVLVSALFFLVGAAGAAEPVKVFLLGGQSNMVGAGKSSELAVPYSDPHPEVKLWHGGKWVALAAVGRTFGPEVSFGHAIRTALAEDDIYLVKYAASGTALYNDWSPSGGGQYNRFMTTAKAALANLEAAGTDFEIAGMLWMQGESDAAEKQADAYEANLRAFIADMRGKFDTPEMPFSIGRVKDFYGGASGQAAIVRAAQQKVAESSETIGWFDTDSYSLANAGHYDAGGLVDMGKDFAKSLQGMLPKKEAARRSSLPEKHTFHSADGTKSFSAVLTGYDLESEMVTVRRADRSVIKFKIDTLSKEDQDYVREQGK